MSGALHRHVFNGADDATMLNDFLRSEHLYAGSLAWLSGTSLKGTWMGLFEFFEAQPVSEVWTSGDAIVALTQVWPDRWRMQSAPALHTHGHMARLARRADRLCRTLAHGNAVHTHVYASNALHQRCVVELGYMATGVKEVLMERTLDAQTAVDVDVPEGIEGIVVRLLDSSDALLMEARAMAQGDAFSDGQPTPAGDAWQRRNVWREASYGDVDSHIDLLAVDAAGRVLAFVSVQADRKHGLGEFEPVGTRSACQRRGLAGLLMRHALAWLRDAGVRRVAVRTDADNHAAIAAYKAAGFRITDRLHTYTRALDARDAG